MKSGLNCENVYVGIDVVDEEAVAGSVVPTSLLAFFGVIGVNDPG